MPSWHFVMAQRSWKNGSIPYGIVCRTDDLRSVSYGLTGVGARDACASKKKYGVWRQLGNVSFLYIYINHVRLCLYSVHCVPSDGNVFPRVPPICQNINIETPPFLAVINIDFLAVLVVVSSFTFLPFPSLTFVPAAAISMYRPFITLKPLGKGCPSAASQRCCAKGNKERPVFTLFKFSFYQKLNHSKTIWEAWNFS